MFGCGLLYYFNKDKEWIEGEKMGAFLSVSQGSVEPPKFLEVRYNGDKSTDKHAAIVGKGKFTFLHLFFSVIRESNTPPSQ